MSGPENAAADRGLRGGRHHSPVQPESLVTPLPPVGDPVARIPAPAPPETDLPWLGEQSDEDTLPAATPPISTALAPSVAEADPEPLARTVPAVTDQPPGLVQCPECGTSAMVEFSRRDAQDFCGQCDYPLFWARSEVIDTDPLDTGGAASRRLPGTVGRAVIASSACPHCDEPNLPGAVRCVRCGLPMQLQPAPVAPRAPAAASPVEPAPIVADKRRYRWLWVLLLLTTLVVAGLVAMDLWY